MASGYNPIYRSFDSPLMAQLRREAYGEDIGQHSWVTADQLRDDLRHLGLTSASRLLDLGCGPCGPLVFMVQEAGCRASGIDLSPDAVESGRARARQAGLDEQIEILVADLNGPLPVGNSGFDAAISIDAVLHLRDRAGFFREVARVLAFRGRFLFTDAGVLTGPVTAQELTVRSSHGFAQFVPPGHNEKLLSQTGFHRLWSEDRTASVIANATGRHRARSAHHAELEQVEGEEAFNQQQLFLENVIDLAGRGSLSRIAYCAEAAG